MSVKVMSAVWEADLPRPQLFVLLCLADHADDQGGHVFPSVARVAWKCGYERRQIQRILHDLRVKGVLRVIREASANHPTEYRILVDKLPKKPPFREGRHFDTPVPNDTPGASRATSQGSHGRRPNHQSTINKPSGRAQTKDERQALMDELREEILSEHRRVERDGVSVDGSVAGELHP